MLAATDLAKQDSSTKQENVEFDARLCTISEDGSISDGSYKETFDIYSGGILQVTIKVKETGYLKNAKVRFKDNNYIINDFSHVQIIKSPNASTEGIENNVQNILNETSSNSIETKDTSTENTIANEISSVSNALTTASTDENLTQKKRDTMNYRILQNF